MSSEGTHIDPGQELGRMHTYRPKPAQWMIDFLGFAPGSLFWSMNPGYDDHEWDSTIQFPGDEEPRPCPNPIVALLRAWAAGYQRISVQSATGTGKTFSIAAGMLHYLDTHAPSIVKAYAPDEKTLENQVFGYIGELLSGLGQSDGFKGVRPKAVKHNDLNLYINPDADDRDRWKASGEAVEAYSGQQAENEAESAAGAQGSHAEYQTLIIEEAPGVHSAIWNALDTTLSAKNQLIAYGNPDAESDPLNQFAERPSVVSIRISSFDHPNVVCGEEVITGAVDPNHAQSQEEKWGSRDHPMWKSRVRGICPRSSGACLFKEKALEAVEQEHTYEDKDGEEAWIEPLFEMPHAPGRWRKTLLTLAQEDGTDVTDEDLEEALGIYDIEGYTRIYEAPVRDSLGRYVLSLDVAGDYAEGDYHAGILYDRVKRHIVAEIHLTGPREAYALAALALARMYRVPHERDLEEEEKIEARPESWASRRYVESERTVRQNPRDLTWPGRQQSYPKLAWETNGVGALHKVSAFKGYPNLYYDKNPDIKGGNRSRRMGWQTTGGDNGSRTEQVENLRDWHHLLAYEPEACPSEGLLSEMKTFQRNKDRNRYEAGPGAHDDLVMALSIALTAGDRLPAPTEAKTPSPAQQRTERSTPPQTTSSSGSTWAGAASSGTWGVNDSRQWSV